MAEVIKKNSKLLIIIALITIVLITFYFLRKAPASRAGEEIKIFPISSIGTWQKPENAFSQDLAGQASLELFNTENSAYPQKIQDGKVKDFSPEERKIIKDLIEQPAEEVQEEINEEIKEVEEENQIIEKESQLEEEPEESTPEPEQQPEPLSEPEPVSLWQNIKRFFKFFPVFAQEENSSSTPALEEPVSQLEEELIINNEEEEETFPETELTEEPAEELTEEPESQSIEETPEGDQVIEEIKDQYLVEDIFELNNFSLADDFFSPETKIQNVQLRISMAGQGGAGDKLAVRYNWRDKDQWENLAEFDLEKGFSNLTNGGYFLFGLPITSDPEFFKNLKIRFIYLDVEQEEEIIKNQVFVDAAWLEVEYEKIIEEEEEEIKTEKLTKKHFRADELPEFLVLGLTEGSSVDSFILLDPENNEVAASDFVKKQGKDYKFKITEKQGLKPGKYILKIRVRENDEIREIQQEFLWGVLAINVNKSIYLSEETAYLQMAVLNDVGHTICDARLELRIMNQQLGIETILSTENGTIKYSPSCGPNNVTDQPDYFAYYQVDQPGDYEMKLINLDNGYEIDDSFSALGGSASGGEVRQSVPFEVERIGATRINPFFASYVMTIRIKANQDFKGKIIEDLPNDFEIRSQILDSKFQILDSKIIWQVDLKTGEETELKYEYQAPKISPQFYLLGPLQFSAESNDLQKIFGVDKKIIFEESRQWQIASDASNQLILFWDTTIDPDIPAGWASVSGSGQTFYQKFIRGAEDYSGTPGGNANHTHTQGTYATLSVSEVSASYKAGKNNTPTATPSHSHTGTLGGLEGSNEPAYRTLVVIRSTGESMPSTLPANIVAMFDSAPDGNWTQLFDQNNYYIRGDSSAGSTGGNVDNQHQHTITITFNLYPGDVKTTATESATLEHTHTVVNQTTNNATYQPPYQEIQLYYNSSGNSIDIPDGLIGMFDATEPNNWTDISGSGGKFYNRFIKPLASGSAQSGGGTHTHTNISGVLSSFASPGANNYGAGTSPASMTADHQHTIGITFSPIPESSMLPPYIDVVIAQYAPVFNTAPAFDVGYEPWESPASTTTTPTNMDDYVTFKATATDTEGDNWYLAICKAEGITPGAGGAAPTCDNNPWVVSSTTSTSGAEISLQYQITSGETLESYNWYAYACDDNAGGAMCTAVASNSGRSGVGGSPFYVNHRPTFTVFVDDSPINPDGVVTFNTTSTDADTDGQVRLYVCTTAAFTGGASPSCTVSEWCHSLSAVDDDASCSYDDADDIFQDGNWEAYGYIVDDHGLVSDGVAQGTDSTLTVSNVAPSITDTDISLLDTDGSGELVPKTPNGETEDFLVKFIVTDQNSCLNKSSGNEIASALIHVYRSSITQSGCDDDAEDDTDSCYANAQAGTGGRCFQDATVDSCTGAADVTVGWTCEFPLYYHVDPTVATNTQFPDDVWLVSVKATDDNSADTGLVEDDDGNEMDKLMAYSLNASTVDYGSVAPDNESIEKTITFSAQGNVGLDAEYSGIDMSYLAETPIPVEQQKYDFTSSLSWSAMTYILDETPTQRELNCKKTTDSGQESKNTYFKLKVPSGQNPGSYEGTDTFAGVEGEVAGW